MFTQNETTVPKSSYFIPERESAPCGRGTGAGDAGVPAGQRLSGARAGPRRPAGGERAGLGGRRAVPDPHQAASLHGPDIAASAYSDSAIQFHFVAE